MQHAKAPLIPDFDHSRRLDLVDYCPGALVQKNQENQNQKIVEKILNQKDYYIEY